MIVGADNFHVFANLRSFRHDGSPCYWRGPVDDPFGSNTQAAKAVAPEICHTAQFFYPGQGTSGDEPMSEIVNLNKARKDRAKSDRKALAAENRAKFGQAKAVTSLEKARKAKAERALDQTKRET
jgi:hypothetical protein